MILFTAVSYQIFHLHLFDSSYHLIQDSRENSSHQQLNWNRTCLIMLIAVVRFNFSVDLLCDVVATYFNFSRLVKICQKLLNLCHFFNGALKEVCFPNKTETGKNIWLFTFQYLFCFYLFSMLWGSASRFFAAKLRASVAVESFLCAFLA